MNIVLFHDIRYALRILAKAPGFTAIAILTLALGIGANTAIFTVANSLLLRPLPYADPGNLCLVTAAVSAQRDQLRPFSYPRFAAMAEKSQTFSGLAAFTNESFNFTGRGEPEQLNAARASRNFFDVLGLRPAAGRFFLADEDRQGGRDVVVISHEFWTRRLAADPAILGQSLTLDSREYTIVGILPPGFSFGFLGGNVDVWAPRAFELNLLTPAQVERGAGFLSAVARLRPGTTLAQAQAEMDVLNQQYLHDDPEKADAVPDNIVDVGELQSKLVSGVRPALLLLLGAVGVVLLIACANVASLLLSRALARRKEIAVRTALGAGRWVLIRQLLTESVLLSLVAGAAGILIGWLGTRLLFALGQDSLLPTSDIHMDLGVLAFTAAISLASGVLFGLVPAVQISRTDLTSTLRDEGRGASGGRRRNAARQTLVVSQIALSMILLVGSGLLMRSFMRLQTVSPGFDPRNILTMQISLPPAKYATAQQMVDFYDETLRRTQTIPGVESAAISSAIPVNPIRFTPVLMEGQPNVPLGQRPILNVQTISPGYAEVMRVPLVRGREFNGGDVRGGPLVALVNQALVRRYWPNENPIGKRLWVGRFTNPTEVVGVLGDVKNMAIATEPQPEFYLPFPQLPWAYLNLSLRTKVEPHSLVSAVRQQMSLVDKDQPLTHVQSMEEVLEAARASSRFTMILVGVFSGTAFVLALVGIYGVISYSTAQRTQEVGIRMALGAGRRDLLQLIVGHGAVLAGIGIIVGLAGSLALGRLVASQLYQIKASDPLALAASALIFMLVSLGACYIPARRATRVNPLDALRYD